MYIGKNIKFLRTQKGCSQEELSKALGYKSYTTITKWESGISEPTLKMTNQIADFFNVSVNDLCYKKMWSTEATDTSPPQLTKKDERDIAKKLDETLEQLNAKQGLMFDGEALDDETKELLKISLENAIRTAKVTAKKKFTPKKYRKE